MSFGTRLTSKDTSNRQTTRFDNSKGISHQSVGKKIHKGLIANPARHNTFKPTRALDFNTEEPGACSSVTPGFFRRRLNMGDNRSFGDTFGATATKRKLNDVAFEINDNGCKRAAPDPEVPLRKTNVVEFIRRKIKTSGDPKVVRAIINYVEGVFDTNTSLFGIYEKLLKGDLICNSGNDLKCQFLGHGNFHLVFDLIDPSTNESVGRVLKIPFRATGDTVAYNCVLKNRGIDVLEIKQEGAVITQNKCHKVFSKDDLLKYLTENQTEYSEFLEFLYKQIETYIVIAKFTAVKNKYGDSEFPIFDIGIENCGLYDSKWVIVDAGGEMTEDDWCLHLNKCINDWINLLSKMPDKDNVEAQLRSLIAVPK